MKMSKVKPVAVGIVLGFLVGVGFFGLTRSECGSQVLPDSDSTSFTDNANVRETTSSSSDSLGGNHSLQNGANELETDKRDFPPGWVFVDDRSVGIEALEQVYATTHMIAREFRSLPFETLQIQTRAGYLGFVLPNPEAPTLIWLTGSDAMIDVVAHAVPADADAPDRFFVTDFPHYPKTLFISSEPYPTIRLASPARAKISFVDQGGGQLDPRDLVVSYHDMSSDALLGMTTLNISALDDWGEDARGSEDSLLVALPANISKRITVPGARDEHGNDQYWIEPTSELRLAEKQEVDVTIRFLEEISMRIQVVDPDGEPVSNASVRMYGPLGPNGEWRAAGTVEVDPQGRAQLRARNALIDMITVSAPNFHTEQVPFQPSATSGLVTVRLRPGERLLTVRVLEDGELSTTPTTIRAQQGVRTGGRGHGSAWEVETESGEVHLDLMSEIDLESGRAVVRAIAPGYKTRPTAHLVEPTDKLVIFELVRKDVLHLTIEGAQDSGVAILSSPMSDVTTARRSSESDSISFDEDTRWPVSLKVVGGLHHLRIVTRMGQIHLEELTISGDTRKTVSLDEPPEIHWYQLLVPDDLRSELEGAFVVSGPIVLQGLHSARRAAFGTRQHVGHRNAPRDPVREAAYAFRNANGQFAQPVSSDHRVELPTIEASWYLVLPSNGVYPLDIDRGSRTAQTETANWGLVFGRVKDNEGRHAQARVTVRTLATEDQRVGTSGADYRVRTGEDGAFSVAIPPGIYDISYFVLSEGNRPMVSLGQGRQRITVAPGEEVNVSFPIEDD